LFVHKIVAISEDRASSMPYLGGLENKLNSEENSTTKNNM
jgi:hypothetical protein